MDSCDKSAMTVATELAAEPCFPMSDRAEGKGGFGSSYSDYEDYDDFSLGEKGSGGGFRAGEVSKSNNKGKGGGMYSSKHTRIRENRPKNQSKTSFK